MIREGASASEKDALLLRSIFVPEVYKQKSYTHTLRAQTKMSFRYYEPEQAGGMLVYEGSRRQRGGNLIGTLGQVVARPPVRFSANRAKAIGKDVAKRSLRAGVGAITDKIRG